MHCKEHELIAYDGIKLFIKVLLPETKPKGLICLVHGMGEHSGRFGHVAEAYIQAGYIFAAFDLRGHGKSGGKRGHTPSYNQLMDDLEQVLNEAQKKYPDLPCFLYGHSMGGNLVANYIIRRKPKLKGAIITSPWLQLAFSPTKLVMFFANIIDKVYPSFSMKNTNKTNFLSHYPVIELEYINDPLVTRRITPRMFISIAQAGLWAIEHAGEFGVPLLLMHGSDDHTTSFEDSKKFSTRLTQPHTFKAWEGMYHELHNEIVKDEVLKYMVDWVKQQ